MACAVWLSSGTLSPYVQLTTPLVTEPCHYLLNVDHEQNVAGSLFLEGADRSRWASSPVIRRILYPVLAYPFVALAGLLTGGLLCNILMTAAAMFSFGRFVEKRYGPAAGIAVVWLLATYPGITYWAGLPYAYAAIVPVSLFAAMLLYRMDSATRLREIAVMGLLLGILLLAYDLAPFFVPAAMLLLVRKRKWLFAAMVAALSVAPSAAVVALLSRAGLSPVNENTHIYVRILMAYRHPGIRNPGLGAWFAYLEQLPSVFVANYFDSNFFFLPLLGIVAVLLVRRNSIGPVEGAILCAVLAVFLFNNVSPPYYGWQLRGVWIARLYQPVFVVLLLCIARGISSAGPGLRRTLTAAIMFTVVANATVAFGPAVKNPMALYLHYRFYRHAPPETFAENLAFYGRRPLGVCATPAEAERQRRPRHVRDYPAPFAYRLEPSR